MFNLTIIICIVALAILTHYKGSRILLTAIISFYPASMIYSAIPNKGNMLFLGNKGISLFYSHALIYGIIFLLIFFALYKITQHENLGFGLSRWINSALISASFVLILIALSLHILPAYNIFQIESRQIKSFWSGELGLLVSLLAPILAIWRTSKGGL